MWGKHISQVHTMCETIWGIFFIVGYCSETYKVETKVFISKHFSLEVENSVATMKEVFYQNKDFGNKPFNQKIVKFVTLA